MPNVEARPIKADEVETSRRIGGYAYANWSDELDDWTPDEDELNGMLATFVDGTMSARLTNNSFEQVVRGQWQSASGIGAVATLPEFRRQGHVRKLFEATFAQMNEKGQAVSALYPFNQSFYAKFGYIRTNPIPRVKLECAALSHLLPLVNQAGNGWHYERMPAVQSGNALQDFSYQIVQTSGRTDYNGWMRNPVHTAKDWANEQIVFVKEEKNDGGEEIVAAARYVLQGYGDGAIQIRECHWTDAHARDRLLAFFALHSAGMPTVELSISPGVNFHSWLSDSAKSYDVKMSHIPLMVRVMDVERVLSGIRVREFSSAQRIVVNVADPLCPWVGGTFALKEAEGILNAKRTDEKSNIEMSIEGLTALAYGTLSVSEISYRGWLTNASDDDLHILESWFPEQSIFNLLGF